MTSSVIQPASRDPQLVLSSIPPDLQEDARVLPTVPEYLAKGQDLMRWWAEVESKGGPENQFPLERSFNRPNRSFGFYADAPVGGRMMPVMGNVQEMFYDQTRAPASLGRDSADWMWAQIREFVMKYFMRVSSFRQPEAHVDASQPIPPPALARLSWCPDPQTSRIGFGFTQLFNKPVGANEIRAFPSFQRSAIVDQRDLGKIYDWLVLKVRIFDFNFSSRPFGQNGPELVFGADEESYLVVHKEFINHKDHHIPKVLGDYGIGYSFIKSPHPGIFGYGPGEFDAALELINFRVYETGYVTVRMIFIANRPTRVANLAVDPVGWSFSLANALSFGLASQIFGPASEMLAPFSPRITVDPVLAYINAANTVSGGDAARTLCISMETLEKLFLLKHFQQHYQTLVGSLLTWRQIPDWLDESKLPAWVISGVGS